jgi:hypothetical protein
VEQAALSGIATGSAQRVEIGGVASFLITMRPRLAVLEPGHFAGFNPGPESFRGIADFLNPIGYLLALCLVHSASRLKRTGLFGHTKGLFYQISGDRKSVGLGDHLLQFTCITPVGGVV